MCDFQRYPYFTHLWIFLVRRNKFQFLKILMCKNPDYLWMCAAEWKCVGYWRLRCLTKDFRVAGVEEVERIMFVWRSVHPGEEIYYDSIRVNKVLLWCSFVCIFVISMIPWGLLEIDLCGFMIRMRKNFFLYFLFCISVLYFFVLSRDFLWFFFSFLYSWWL